MRKAVELFLAVDAQSYKSIATFTAAKFMSGFLSCCNLVWYPSLIVLKFRSNPHCSPFYFNTLLAQYGKQVCQLPRKRRWRLAMENRGSSPHYDLCMISVTYSRIFASGGATPLAKRCTPSFTVKCYALLQCARAQRAHYLPSK